MKVMIKGDLSQDTASLLGEARSHIEKAMNLISQCETQETMDEFDPAGQPYAEGYKQLEKTLTYVEALQKTRRG